MSVSDEWIMSFTSLIIHSSLTLIICVSLTYPQSRIWETVILVIIGSDNMEVLSYPTEQFVPAKIYNKISLIPRAWQRA